MTFTESQLSLLGEFRQLAELEAKATPGPWRATSELSEVQAVAPEWRWPRHTNTREQNEACFVANDINGHDNALFISAARNQTLALLKRVVELGERLEFVSAEKAELQQKVLDHCCGKAPICCGDAHAELEWMLQVVTDLGFEQRDVKKDGYTERSYVNVRAEAAEEQKARLERAIREIKAATDNPKFGGNKRGINKLATEALSHV